MFLGGFPKKAMKKIVLQFCLGRSFLHDRMDDWTNQALKYFGINHGDRRVFQFKIIRNVFQKMSFTGVTVLIRQNLTSVDVRF